MKTTSARQTLSNFLMSLSLAGGIAVSAAVSAALIGLNPGHPLMSFNTTGTTSYNAGTDSFTVDAAPISVQFVLGQRPRTVSDSTSDGAKSVSINISVNASGALVGGAPGDDLIVIGAVDTDGDNSLDADGVLLTGEVRAFGFFNSATPTDKYDFAFVVTGGLLAPFYTGQDIGVTLTSENSNFNGNFTVNFGGGAKGNIGPVPPLPPTAALGDRVWEDLNADGVQNCVDDGNGDLATPGDGNGIVGDAGDVGPECGAGIPSVVVELFNNPDGDTQCTSGDEVSLGTTLTDTEGFYLFDNLDPDLEYCVRFDKTTAADQLNCATLPGPAEFTFQDIGGDDAADSDADRMTGRTTNISLLAGQTDRSWDAGLYCPAKIGDMLILDSNRDGIQDPAEPGIEGQTVELVKCIGGVPDTNIIDTRVTDPDGMYMFNPLPPGEYAVRFTKPGDTVFSPMDQGVDDTVDCDTDPNGWTQCVTLLPREYNQDVDACVNPPPAGLGDFVFEDKNADGEQDAGEPGIPDVTVNLLDPEGGNCAGATTVLDTTMTDPNGLYQFIDLNPGDYCVEFVKPDICEPIIGGSAQFSPRDAAADDKDSDADTTSGRTGIISLDPNEFDPTNDAGVFCPAKIGDVLIGDIDGDGIQDPGELGVPGQLVELLKCDNNVPGNVVIGSQFTAGDGMYMFNPLVPGEYAVRFSKPNGTTFSPRDQGMDDSVDCDVAPDGVSQCVTLGSNEYNPTVDACVVQPPVCDLTVQKTCQIIPVVTTNVTCSDVKPLNEISMIWNDGTRTIAEINVYSTKYDPGNPADNLIQTFGGTIVQGDEFTASGYVAAGATNDVDWVITFDDGSQAISRFHRSCSDDDMDGPEDCGSPQGDAKNNGATTLEGLAVANVWKFEALAGNGQVLDCTVPNVPGTDTACTFSTASGDLCDGNVEAMTFRYTEGADCTIESDQDPSKNFCTATGIPGDPVRVVVSKDDGSEVYADVSNVNDGDVVVASAANGGVSGFDNNSLVQVFSNTGDLVQGVEFHASCSQPIELNDRYGALTVVGINTDKVSGSLGVDVQYDYTVTNPGQSCDVTLVDDQLGTLFAGTPLGNGASATASRSVFVLPDASNVLTNTATATCTLANGQMCMGQASATVTRVEPPEPQLTCDELKPLTSLGMIWNGPSGVDVMTDNGEFFENVQTGNRITFDVTGGPNDFPIMLSGAATGGSQFHLSCSDDDMDGPEDCGLAQGNAKDNSDPSFNNQWQLDAMFGENGQFVCDAPSTGVVDPSDPPAGGDVVGGMPELTKDEFRWDITNNTGGDLVISQVQLTWPTQQGELKEMKLDGDKFAENLGAAPPIASFTAANFVSDANKRTLEAGDTEEFKLKFDDDFEGDVPTDYQVTITFEGGTVVSFNAP